MKVCLLQAKLRNVRYFLPGVDVSVCPCTRLLQLQLLN